MAEARIIVSLGSPSDFSAGAAEAFLRGFLSDPLVLPLPSPFREFFARRVAKKRAAAYAKQSEKLSLGGKFITKHYAESLAEKVGAISGVPTFAAYRYGENDIARTVAKLRESGFDEFSFAAAYPQFSNATTLSAKLAAEEATRGLKFRFAQPYFDNPLYIDMLAESLGRLGDCGAIIASFHSVPESQRSPYAEQCERTVSLLCEKSGRGDIMLGWQSKTGRGRWLEPATRGLLGKCASRGIKKVGVLCPAFFCDCTETLAEIDRDARAYFLERGGESFEYAPCPNDSDAQAKLFRNIFENIK
ncbi:ferrochelatase [Opitutia bacterium KCR 482]|nr:ferrochelatase [Opitutae bacterium KCR 482]